LAQLDSPGLISETIDNRRISGNMLTILTSVEMGKIELYWRIVLDLE
jgi:hypothetical protein